MSAEYIKATLEDFNLIVSTWGSNVNNFRYLTSKVLDTEVYAKEYLAKTLANPASVAYHIKSMDSNVGLVKAVVDGHRALVGYVVNEPYWGQGYASAAVSFITNKLHSDTRIQRIWATCALNNVPSQRVLEKCGYTQECTLKNWVVYPLQGEIAHDNYSYVWSGKF